MPKLSHGDLFFDIGEKLNEIGSLMRKEGTNNIINVFAVNYHFFLTNHEPHQLINMQILKKFGIDLFDSRKEVKNQVKIYLSRSTF